jgi:predicted RNase H-like nuclease (RuvC/YqgF family)
MCSSSANQVKEGIDKRQLQEDLRKIISDTNARLHNCESENSRLKSDNVSLIQQVKNLNTIKNHLEKQLSC